MHDKHDNNYIEGKNTMKVYKEEKNEGNEKKRDHEGEKQVRH